MADRVVVLVTGSGALVAAGLVLVVAGLRSRAPQLSQVMGVLGGDPSVESPARRAALVQGETDLAGRVGAWAFTRLRLPLRERTRRVLGLRGRSIGDYFAEKLILATLGLATPPLLTAAVQGAGQLVTPLPLVAALACSVVGWFWPELALHRQDQAVRADAGEAVFTFFDLVTLERLANASSAQAMMAAASLSQLPLFVRLRSSLERARLEQRPPWQELRRLSEELELSEIADIADVMRLDEQGAALTGTLRARVKELRDAHLMDEKLAAQQVSERMTLWMVVPSMVFGLVFLAPPLLKLAGLAP